MLYFNTKDDKAGEDMRMTGTTRRMMLMGVVLGVFFSSCGAEAAEEVIFCLGEPDGTTRGFGLSNASYHPYAQTYTQPVVFRIGKDKIKNWPFIHPSTRDVWASSKAHTFSIRFNREKVIDKPVYLHLGLVDTWEPSMMTVTVNGEQIARRRVPVGSEGTQLAFNPKAKGKPVTMSFEIGPGKVKAGENRIEITLSEGSWIIYDYVMLSGEKASPKLKQPKGPELLKECLADPLVENPEIIFAVRQPGKDGHWYANFSYYARQTQRKTYGDGGKLCRLNLRTGELTVLLEDPKGGVRDPQVHYDGEKIIFSYRKGGSEHYHLYEIGVDGNNLRQLTDGLYDDIEPTYLPDGGIMFCSSRCKRWVNCWLTEVAVLFRCDGDGGNIRMVSSNNEHENTPWVLPDGRILYQRWEYVDRSQVHYHHLWTTNPDGTGQMIYYGNMHPGTVMIDAKPIEGTKKVVAIFSPGHGKQEHEGAVTVVDPSGGPDEKTLARTVHRGDNFRDPYPISEEYFLVARGTELLLMNEQGELEQIYQLSQKEREAGMHCHEPRVLHKRQREHVIPPRSDPQEETGRYFVSDIYLGRNMAGVERGTIKKLLVLETLPKPINYTGGMEPLSYGGTFTLERIMGTVPVETDGSAYFEVPALRSVFFVALDENNMSVKRMQSFTAVMPGEVTGCVGCHEQRTRTVMPSQKLMALQRKPSRIAPLEQVPEVFDFPRDIQPILDKHCVGCHGYKATEKGGPRAGGVILTGDRGPMYSHSYYTLTYRRQFVDGRNDPKSNLPPRAIGAVASPLMKKINGEHQEVKLSAHEVDMIRYWIESGAAYPGTYAALGTGMIGGYYENNQVVTDWEWPTTQAGADVIQRRCMNCHKEDRVLPRSLSDERDVSFWRPSPDDPRLRMTRHLVFNLTRPEESLLLLAPLAEEAGGYGICKIKDEQSDREKAVFGDRDDPGYQKMLALCRAGKERLDKMKRFDMPGFQPDPAYVREMKRYGIFVTDDQSGASIDVYAADRKYWQSLWWRPDSD
jgi:mono/diheme cytochrome c family protein